MVMLFSISTVHAQKITDTLKEVKVKGRYKERVSNDERLNTYSPGQKIQSFDSVTLRQYQYQSIANLLTQQVPVFVKSYGLNGLATLNFRGASAAQSQVYWNGIPLQNAALGIADVSLLPVSLIDKVSIVYGGSSALWGSGNVGGALVIENNMPFFDSAGSWVHSVSAVAGSFQQYQAGAKTVLSTDKWFFTANLSGQSARNNFRYDDNGTEKRMNHSELRSGVALLQAAYKADKHNTISLSAWYQQYNRDIPPALFERISAKNQRDESLRFLLDWNRKTDKATFYAKTAFTSDYMQYADSMALLNSKNTTNQFYTESGLRYKLSSNQQLMLFAPVQIAWIERHTMSDSKIQNKFALAGAYAVGLFDEQLNIALNLRGEIINDIGVLLPGINLSYAPMNWLTFRGNLQRSYRAPTLNELYYVPGGNDKLKPEQGWSEDAGYSIKTKQNKTLVFVHDVSFFNRVINDWIIWFGGAIWTPHNIATVRSHGIETQNSIRWSIDKNWKLQMGINTAYVIATTQKSYISNDGSVGKQIPYTPRYNGQLNFGITWKRLYFNYNHTYTGYRFITIDESQYILPFNTGNIQLLYNTDLLKMPLQLTAQCNNTWNNRYSVVNARPMPGVNFLVGLKATIQ